MKIMMLVFLFGPVVVILLVLMPSTGIFVISRNNLNMLHNLPFLLGVLVVIEGLSSTLHD